MVQTHLFCSLNPFPCPLLFEIRFQVLAGEADLIAGMDKHLQKNRNGKLYKWYTLKKRIYCEGGHHE